MLEGLPNLQDLDKLMIGESVPEGLSCDLTLERRGRADLVAAIGAARPPRDYVSRDLLRTSSTRPRSTSTTSRPSSS